MIAAVWRKLRTGDSWVLNPGEVMESHGRRTVVVVHLSDLETAFIELAL